MRRPLLIVALFYGAGILTTEYASLPLAPVPLMAGTFVLACVALISIRVRPWLIWVALFLLGASNLTLHKALLSPHDLRVLAGDGPRIAELHGTLTETPYHRVYDNGDEQSWRTLAELEVQCIRFGNGARQPAFGRVMVSTPGILPASFLGGRRVVVEGVLRNPNEASAEGLFDYRKFLGRQSIYHQLQVASTNDWRLDAIPEGQLQQPLADRFSAWAKAALARGLPEEDEPLHLLWAMTLG